MEHVQFFNGLGQKDIEGSEKARFSLANNSLVIVLNDKFAAKITGGHISHEVYSSKTILFLMKDQKNKEIILEIDCPDSKGDEIVKLIKVRNALAGYKDPLKLDYSRNIRDSVLSSASGPANLRGFFNLFIIFSCLNYSRIIIDHSLKYGSIFSKNVS